MNITRKSTLTGVEHTMSIDVTNEQLSAWNGGELIQNVMPNITADEREFLMTGITDDEWTSMWSPDPDDEYR